MPSIIGEVKGIKGGMEIEWKIADFFSLPEAVDARYDSPDFYFAGTSWYLTLYPFGKTSNQSVGKVGCYLNKHHLFRSVNLDVQIGLKRKDGTFDEECSYTKTFDENSKGYGCGNITSRSNLLSRRSDLVPSDALTVICRLTENKPNIVPSK